MLLVNFDTPIAFCRLPETGRGFLAPPLLTLTLTIMIPCFALYPRLRARSSLVGYGIRLTTGSFLKPMEREKPRAEGMAAALRRWLEKGTRRQTDSFLQPTTESRTPSFSSGVFSLPWFARW